MAERDFGLTGLRHDEVAGDGARLHCVQGGPPDGPAVVLLHGFPESWAMWRLVWPALADRYRLVAVDLRGYGSSEKPADPTRMDKGVMARDILAVIQALDLRQPVIVGHDRGARVARRIALDAPAAIAAVALLDILPAEYLYDRLTAGEIAQRYWHWIFHLVPDLPEALIAGNEATYLAQFFNRAPGLLDRLRADGAFAAYLTAFTQPGAVAAQLGDYRALFQRDVPHYRALRAAGQRLSVPALLLWGSRGNLAGFPVLEVWREVATSARGAALADCGHYLPEEQPAAVLEHLLPFLATTARA